MLEQLRRSGASIFIYLIFGLLIVIFVINFAPNAGAGSGGGGCLGTTDAVLTVDGHKVNQSGYHIAYSGNQYSGRQKVYVALEMLIRRELLAQAAADHGLRASGDLVDEEIKKGYFFLGGQRMNLGQQIFDEVDGEKFFNIKKLKGWVNSLNVSMGSYRDEQTRGLQAAMMSELLQDSVRVSRDEALADYLFENTTATYDVVAFSPTDYAKAMRLTDADITRFIAGHEDEVKAKYKAEERTYKATKPSLKLRSIFIAKAAPAATPPAPAPSEPGTGSGSAAGSGSGAGSGSAAVAVTPPAPDKSMDEAKAKLEAARTAIAAGKTKFADAAKQLSTDDARKATGGDPQWKPIDNAGLGDKAVNDAVKTLKVGDMTPVIVTDNGAYLVIAEDKREGDLSYDQVKAEIAAELAKTVWSKEAAKRAALAGLEQAKTAGKPLDQIFDRGVDEEEQRRRIEQQIQEQMMQQHGSIVRESENIPASWQAGDGSSTGSGAGSGSAAGTPPTTPPAPVVDTLAPSKDELPKFDAPKAKVIEHGPSPRMKQMPGLGTAKDAIGAVFDELSSGMLAPKVYEVDGSYIILQVKEKSQPKVEDFDKVAEGQLSMLRQLRGRALVEEWMKTRCEELAKAGKIKPHGELIEERDDKGNAMPVVYRPCMSFR